MQHCKFVMPKFYYKDWEIMLGLYLVLVTLHGWFTTSVIIIFHYECVHCLTAHSLLNSFSSTCTWWMYDNLAIFNECLRTTSHMSQDPWPWNCKSPKEVCKSRPKTLPKSWSVVTCPQPNTISINFYSYRILTHDLKIINQHMWIFGVSWSPNIVLGLCARDDFSK